MEADGWPRILPERFDGEDIHAYRARATRIEELMTGFRMGRFERDVAEQRERELIELQEQGIPMRRVVAANDRTGRRPTRVQVVAALR